MRIFLDFYTDLWEITSVNPYEFMNLFIEMNPHNYLLGVSAAQLSKNLAIPNQIEYNYINNSLKQFGYNSYLISDQKGDQIFKTNAPIKDLYDIMKCWKKQIEGKNYLPDSLDRNSYQYKILSKEPDSKFSSLKINTQQTNIKFRPKTIYDILRENQIQKFAEQIN